MKNQTFGVYTCIHRDMCRSASPLYMEGMRASAHYEYEEKRRNLEAEAAFCQPGDGKITWIKGEVKEGYVHGVKESDGDYHYEVRYDEGPKDKAFMEELDWAYIQSLMRDETLLEKEPNADKEIAADHKYRAEIMQAMGDARRYASDPACVAAIKEYKTVKKTTVYDLLAAANEAVDRAIKSQNYISVLKVIREGGETLKEKKKQIEQMLAEKIKIAEGTVAKTKEAKDRADKEPTEQERPASEAKERADKEARLAELRKKLETLLGEIHKLLPTLDNLKFQLLSATELEEVRSSIWLIEKLNPANLYEEALTKNMAYVEKWRQSLSVLPQRLDDLARDKEAHEREVEEQAKRDQEKHKAEWLAYEEKTIVEKKKIDGEDQRLQDESGCRKRELAELKEPEIENSRKKPRVEARKAGPTEACRKAYPSCAALIARCWEERSKRPTIQEVAEALKPPEAASTARPFCK